MSTICSDQEIVKNTLSRSIDFERQNPGRFALPSEILEIFFRKYPRKRGLHFINSNPGRIYSAKEIEGIEKKVTDKLLATYSGYTQTPRTRDVLTDVFAELKKLNISVSISNSN